MPVADPKENLKNLDLKEGLKVADFGTGSGFYALELARRVGSTGQVFAIDVQKDLLIKLQNKAKDEGISNLFVVWGDLDEVGGTKLAPSILDAVLISNVLFQSEKKENLIAEAARILKPGGTAMVIDWSDSFGGLGPRPEHIYKASEAESMFTKLGFALIKSFNAGEHHFGLLFKKI